MVKADLEKQTMPCRKCEGTGELEWAGWMNAVLDELHRCENSSADAVHLACVCRTGQTAMNNRLEHLRKLGLVTRARLGRGWLYTAVPGSKPRSSARPLRSCGWHRDCDAADRASIDGWTPHRTVHLGTKPVK